MITPMLISFFTEHNRFFEYFFILLNKAISSNFVCLLFQMDEDDYMSDKFLQSSVTQSQQLPANKSLWRKRKIEQNKSNCDLKSKMKPKRVIEQEQRDKGLTTSLSNDNLGFKLMAKMGYKEGQGLGKRGDGRAEPVSVVLKSNRSGLGKEASDKAKKEARARFLKIVAEKKSKLEHVQRQDFRARMSQKFSLQQTELDLRTSQKACFQMDTIKDVEDPLYDFFWPDYMTQEAEEQETDIVAEEYTTEDKLSMLTSYLRERYFYCIWCASKFYNLNDIKTNCPGDTSNAHDD